MASEHRFQKILRRNEKYAENHVPPQSIAEAEKVLPSGYGIFILSCADARIEPTEFLGLKNGEAIMIRNAGARVNDDVLRGLEVMGSMLPIGLIAVIHHTDCGGMYRTDDKVREILSARSPDHASTIKDKVWATFRHVGLDESVRQDVEALRAWPFLPEEAKVAG